MDKIKSIVSQKKAYLERAGINYEAACTVQQAMLDDSVYACPEHRNWGIMYNCPNDNHFTIANAKTDKYEEIEGPIGAVERLAELWDIDTWLLWKHNQYD